MKSLTETKTLMKENHIEVPTIKPQWTSTSDDHFKMTLKSTDLYIVIFMHLPIPKLTLSCSKL
jgi:hypothetical protein